MRDRFEILATAAAMAEGGCEDEARHLCQELEALKVRSRETIVIALGPEATSNQTAYIEQLLTRFSADVLLMIMGEVRRTVLIPLHRSIADKHFLTILHIKNKDIKTISTVIRALKHIQFAICAGVKFPLCSENTPFPVFTV